MRCAGASRLEYARQNRAYSGFKSRAGTKRIRSAEILNSCAERQSCLLCLVGAAHLDFSPLRGEKSEFRIDGGTIIKAARHGVPP